MLAHASSTNGSRRLALSAQVAPLCPIDGQGEFVRVYRGPRPKYAHTAPPSNGELRTAARHRYCPPHCCPPLPPPPTARLDGIGYLCGRFCLRDLTIANDVLVRVRAFNRKGGGEWSDARPLGIEAPRGNPLRSGEAASEGWLRTCSNGRVAGAPLPRGAA